MTDFGGFDPPSGPPAGWYPDPYGGPGQRYWDGSAWDLSTPVTGGPYTGADAEEFPDIGDWLDRSFRVAYRRWKALAFLGVITAPASTALAYLAINRLVDGVVIEGDDVTGWTNDRIPMAALLLLAAVVVGAVGSLSVNVLMLRAVDGADPSSGSASDEWSAAVRTIGETLRVLPRAIGWFFALVGGIAVITLVVVVLALIAAPLVVLVLFVAIPFIVWIAIKWSFSVVSVVDRPGNPFPRSSRVSDGRWWRTFGRLLLIGIIVWLITVVIQTAGSLATGSGLTGFGDGSQITVNDDGTIERFSFDEQLTFGTAEIVVASVISVITTVLANSVVASATTVLYRTRNPRD